MIVIGYQGIGKSTLARKQFKYVDLESSALRRDGVRWHNWYEPYCMIAEWLSRQGYIVFVSSHKEVREYLNEFCEEPFCAVIPCESLKDEWTDKLRERYEQFPTDKNYRAYMNAVDRYTENIREIKRDIEDVREIDSMTYELDKLIEKADTPQTDLVKESPSLVKDLVNAFCEDGTWLERQGVYTLTLAEAKQRAVDIIEAVSRKDTADTPQTESTGSPIGDYRDGVGAWQTDCGWK